MQKALSLLLMLSVLACSAPKEKIPDTPAMPGTTKKMVVYQMMTRLFANTNTTNKFYGSVEDNGVGKMNNINDAALKGIKGLGVTHVWYTGIIEHALLTDY
ncbi:MAG: alpha-amylase, partial [Cytophagales bacterium]